MIRCVFIVYVCICMCVHIYNVPVDALEKANEKATLNLSGRVDFDRPLKGSSVNHDNDYYNILKFISESKCTFTDVDNENVKGLV